MSSSSFLSRFQKVVLAFVYKCQLLTRKQIYNDALMLSPTSVDSTRWFNERRTWKQGFFILRNSTRFSINDSTFLLWLRYSKNHCQFWPRPSLFLRECKWNLISFLIRWRFQRSIIWRIQFWQNLFSLMIHQDSQVCLSIVIEVQLSTNWESLSINKLLRLIEKKKNRQDSDQYKIWEARFNPASMFASRSISILL